MIGLNSTLAARLNQALAAGPQPILALLSELFKAIPGVRTKKEFDYPCPFLDRCPYAHPACRTEKAEKIPIHGEHWTLCNAGIKGGAAS